MLMKILKFVLNACNARHGFLLGDGFEGGFGEGGSFVGCARELGERAAHPLGQLLLFGLAWRRACRPVSGGGIEPMLEEVRVMIASDPACPNQVDRMKHGSAVSVVAEPFEQPLVRGALVIDIRPQHNGELFLAADDAR
jgi:hypothetical protein